MLSTEEELDCWNGFLGKGEGRKQCPVCTSIDARPSTQVTTASRHQARGVTIRTRTRQLLLSCTCLTLIYHSYLSLDLLREFPVCPY